MMGMPAEAITFGWYLTYGTSWLHCGVSNCDRIRRFSGGLPGESMGVARAFFGNVPSKHLVPGASSILSGSNLRCSFAVMLRGCVESCFASETVSARTFLQLMIHDFLWVCGVVALRRDLPTENDRVVSRGALRTGAVSTAVSIQQAPKA